MLPSKSDLAVNDAIDVLATNTIWIGAKFFFSPPDDVSCSDEDTADEDNSKLPN